jgi:hypothetical protein
LGLSQELIGSSPISIVMAVAQKMDGELYEFERIYLSLSKGGIMPSSRRLLPIIKAGAIRGLSHAMRRLSDATATSSFWRRPPFLMGPLDQRPVSHIEFLYTIGLSSYGLASSRV